MNLTFKLKAPDIGAVLAEYYGVKQGDVDVRTETTWEGYGVNEQAVHHAYAEIHIKDPEMIRKLMEAAKAKEVNHD